MALGHRAFVNYGCKGSYINKALFLLCPIALLNTVLVNNNKGLFVTLLITCLH